MDKALLQAGVQYLTGCYVTDVLRDNDGQLAGIVMANRSGRQAVRAKVIVDATCRAAVARLASIAGKLEFVDINPPASRIETLARLEKGEISTEQALKILGGAG